MPNTFNIPRVTSRYRAAARPYNKLLDPRVTGVAAPQPTNPYAAIASAYAPPTAPATASGVGSWTTTSGGGTVGPSSIINPNASRPELGSVAPTSTIPSTVAPAPASLTSAAINEQANANQYSWDANQSLQDNVMRILTAVYNDQANQQVANSSAANQNATTAATQIHNAAQAGAAQTNQNWGGVMDYLTQMFQQQQSNVVGDYANTATLEQNSAANLAENVVGAYEDRSDLINQGFTGLASDIDARHQQRYDTGMGLLEGMGRQEASDIRGSWNAQESQMLQGMTDRGLGGTTIAPSMQAGIQREENADLGRLDERLRTQRLGWHADASGAQIASAQNLGLAGLSALQATTGDAVNARSQWASKWLEVLDTTEGRRLSAELGMTQNLLSMLNGMSQGYLSDMSGLTTQELNALNSLVQSNYTAQNAINQQATNNLMNVGVHGADTLNQTQIRPPAALDLSGLGQLQAALGYMPNQGQGGQGNATASGQNGGQNGTSQSGSSSNQTYGNNGSSGGATIGMSGNSTLPHGGAGGSFTTPSGQTVNVPAVSSAAAQTGASAASQAAASGATSEQTAQVTTSAIVQAIASAVQLPQNVMSGLGTTIMQAIVAGVAGGPAAAVASLIPSAVQAGMSWLASAAQHTANNPNPPTSHGPYYVYE